MQKDPIILCNKTSQNIQQFALKRNNCPKWYCFTSSQNRKQLVLSRRRIVSSDTVPLCPSEIIMEGGNAAKFLLQKTCTGKIWDENYVVSAANVERTQVRVEISFTNYNQLCWGFISPSEQMH